MLLERLRPGESLLSLDDEEATLSEKGTSPTRGRKNVFPIGMKARAIVRWHIEATRDGCLEAIA